MGLNKDGISSKPGYVLYDAASFLQNAMNANPSRMAGSKAALRMLVGVQQKLASEREHHSCSNVIVRFSKLAELAKDIRPEHEEAFSQALSLHSERQGDLTIISVTAGCGHSTVSESLGLGNEPGAVGGRSFVHLSTCELLIASLVILISVLWGRYLAASGLVCLAVAAAQHRNL